MTPSVQTNNALDFSNFGTAVPKASGAKVSGPAKVEPKVKFVQSCRNDIALLKAGEKFGRQFTARVSGGYAITFRNGIKTIELQEGCPIVWVDDLEKSVGLFEYVISACEKGQLDAIFAKQAERKLAD